MSTSAQGSDHWREVGKHKEQLLNVGKQAARRGMMARPFEMLGKVLTHPVFFLLVLVFHVGWVVWNSGWLEVPVFDPAPFTLLATIASVEAPFLSLMILMYQGRKQRIDEVRQETELQIALHDERETTKLLQLVSDIHRAMHLNPKLHDETLEHMKEPLRPEAVVDQVEKDED